MGTTETSRFVRLRVDLVVAIEDSVALTGAALQRIEEDAAASGSHGGPTPSEGGLAVDTHGMSTEERIHAITAVQQDEAEALAYLVDPFDLVIGVPGVDLAQASWSSEEIDYDPDSPDWHLGVDDGGEDGETEED
ncbi:hypothetical protein GCM10018793_26080 [Streptomyces sulfonofaciens]|uniref:Uncharacterized protein n=1 Tax=Streptomyces sulfonofaciens TaxID=68272 RepID=A0A919KY53_9ACTN|nr:hypothetical protein [Streptomyces sulfonofaciens]GHH77605.1 hypothetical protein GCM10018793_26080 [Streptomyces sulfonofaciens]